MSDGCEVPNKETSTLIDAYAICWYQRNGPFGIFYSDGEKGLDNEEATLEMKRLGTTLKIRAPGQHARTIESRNGIFRHGMHLIEEGLKQYKIELPFKRLLGKGLSVCNALTFYNGVSPYNCHTGRQPAMLPGFENGHFSSDGEHTDGEREQRIRQAGT